MRGSSNLVKHTIALFSALLIFSGAVYAQTPGKLKGAILVDAVKAKSLKDSGVEVIDARVAMEYAESHIKGAISVPYKEKSAKSADFDPSKDRFDLKKLPSDKNTPILFYCNGAECWKGYKASTAAVKAGYKTVYWLRLGLPAWKAKGYPVE